MPSLGVYYVITAHYSGSAWSDLTGQGASACAGAGARLGGGSRRGRRSTGRGGHRERSSESLGSEARALRKYACDAIAKRQT
eukprot:6176076-Pleurochrysis_carterae.AAC.1